MSSIDSRYNQLAYQLEQVAQQHHLQQQQQQHHHHHLLHQSQLQDLAQQQQLQPIETENFISSSSSSSSSRQPQPVSSFRNNQFNQRKQQLTTRHPHQQHQAANNYHSQQLSMNIIPACNAYNPSTTNCIIPNGYGLPSNNNNNNNNNHNNSNNNVQCNSSFNARPMMNQRNNINTGHLLTSCDSNPTNNIMSSNNCLVNARMTLNDSQSLYVSQQPPNSQQQSTLTQQNYVTDQYSDLKLTFADSALMPYAQSSRCENSQLSTSRQLVNNNNNNSNKQQQHQHYQHVNTDCDSDSASDYQIMGCGVFDNLVSDYIYQPTINQLCAIDQNINNCNINNNNTAISGFNNQSHTDLYSTYRKQQQQQQQSQLSQLSPSSLSIASSDHLFDLGPFENPTSYSPLNYGLIDDDQLLDKPNNIASLLPIGVKPDSTGADESVEATQNLSVSFQSPHMSTDSFVASRNSNIADTRVVEQQQQQQHRQGLQQQQQPRPEYKRQPHASLQHQMDLVEMKSNWNFSQEWLDSICRQLIDHMNKFGICVIDNFLGSLRGDLVLKEVKQLYSSGRYMNGRLVSDRLANDRDSSTDPGAIRNDRVIWVDGCEDGCLEINNLIQTLSSVITNSSRLSLYSNNQLDKVVVNRRTKAHVACYPGNGTRYVKHIDNPNGDGRLITSIYYLNKDWNTKREGGLLRMFPTGTNQVANIEPLFDRALFFWSDRRNPHEVLPAYKDRFAVTVWFIGENRP